MMIYVTKADGGRQPFDRSKVYKTCSKMGLPKGCIEAVCRRVEERIYDGIATRDILRIIREEASVFDPSYSWMTDLRSAISRLRSKPDFEQYARLILEALGFHVAPNQLIRGECVEYELDGLLVRDGGIYILEVKHHVNPHEKVDLTIVLKVRAIIEDLLSGYEKGINQVKVSGGYIVTNAKFTDHALRYARCRGINLLGWGTDEDIEKVIVENKLQPLTIVSDLDEGELRILTDAGIVTLRQLTMFTADRLSTITGISVDRCRDILAKAYEASKKLEG
ncbi:MAG: restriction endonuclease [Nitrososphaerota archaeon]|nr:restriction endonuclease [Candidatus Bathyarchaeota archaeon]MDW8061615.1 restriction endonuclease [Nitrososphaerota archaeon]